ncbi:DUF4834 family protein [Fulvivirga ulvae]|uniref:DUF4834 family protein n=1 Tax=Fulvivirga ulvae TaxID=2904245 RepID=UPI001F3CB841|nr:DUF4834 family protein [Fulvivirga ulvae]UII34494.1 DUF4834 family protein [Fulvivirga ulvae]
MLKFLIIAFLIGFLFFKLLGLFFRILIGRSAADRSGGRAYQNQQYQSGRSNDGNVNIDYVPKNGSNKSPKAFKGGEYVDYEEIK